MANKFQKSVLERLEQESDRHKKSTNRKIIPVEVETHIQPEVQVRQEMKEIENETIPSARALPGDIGDFIRPQLQRQAKNKTFYLDGDVIIAIKKTAKQQGITDSKLVNDILRRVLGIDL